MAQPKPTKILVIANVIPMRDRSGGWFRFYHLLRILADKHDVWLYPSDLAWQLDYYGESDTRKYQGELEAFGIRILVGEWADLLKFVCSARLDILFFEHYGTVKDVDRIRFWHPPAIVMVDTIDVAFNRLLSKATLTGNPEDLQVAEQVKAAELAAYAEADIVIAISHADRTLLLKEAPGLQVDVLPLVYAMPCLGTAKRSLRNNLLFVAHFDHDANIDGITYFCANVLPLIINELPDVRLRVVGHSPPPAVANLASSNVEILGYVPDIAAVYEKSDVAIAPMRFGGGLKGKIGEAMSYGVPVVTNSACLQGFGSAAGKSVLVGDTPEEFANAVLALLRDPSLHDAIRDEGLNYIRANFSEQVVARELTDLLTRSQEMRRKRLSLVKRISWQSQRMIDEAKALLERHILWRFRSRNFRQH